MKNIVSLLSYSLAAGAAGVALLTFAGFLAASSGFATLAALGVATIALLDYSRPVKSLSVLAPVLRPALPGESNSPVAYSARRVA